VSTRDDRRRRKAVRKLPPLKRGDPPWDGRPITCILCGRAGIAGDRSGGEWRAIEADGRFYYACAAEFPPDGSSTAALTRAYERFLRATGERPGPDTDVACQGVEE
jgi:hypothetical protein